MVPCISLSRFLLDIVDSCSTSLQCGTRAPSCVLRGSCWNGNPTPALWKCPMRERWRQWLSCLVQLRGKSIFLGSQHPR